MVVGGKRKENKLFSTSQRLFRVENQVYFELLQRGSEWRKFNFKLREKKREKAILSKNI